MTPSFKGLLSRCSGAFARAGSLRTYLQRMSARVGLAPVSAFCASGRVCAVHDRGARGCIDHPRRLTSPSEEWSFIRVPLLEPDEFVIVGVDSPCGSAKIPFETVDSSGASPVQRHADTTRTSQAITPCGRSASQRRHLPAFARCRLGSLQRAGLPSGDGARNLAEGKGEHRRGELSLWRQGRALSCGDRRGEVSRGRAAPDAASQYGRSGAGSSAVHPCIRRASSPGRFVRNPWQVDDGDDRTHQGLDELVRDVIRPTWMHLGTIVAA